MNKKKKITFVALGIIFLVLITTAASFAFYNYSRTSNSVTTIRTGDLVFSFIEGESATLPNAFPVSDSVGANDTTGEYDFRVWMEASSSTMNMHYNVSLISNNTGDKVFKNNQIKFALLKNGVFVANTTNAKGRKLSEIDGFDADDIMGSGEVLNDQEINPGQTDYYKLRIWISDDVNYTNDIVDGEMVGKYNNFTYSLKVRVNGQLSTTSYKNLNVSNNGDVSVDIEDNFGLKEYAIKRENVVPTESEWIKVEAETAKIEGKIKRIANTQIITRKTVLFKADDTGAYYVFVRNLSNRISRKTIGVTGLKIAVYLEAMGGEITNTNIEVDSDGFYTNLPQPTKPGYIFKGWYTKQTGGELANDLTSYESVKAKTLYAQYDKGTYTLTINPNEGTYDGSTGSKTEQVEYQTNYTLKVPTRVGYTFKGWQINGSGTTIDENTLTMGVEDTKITAKWQINKYTLTVNTDNGSRNQEYTLDYNTTQNITEPTKDGYTFTGWELTGTNSNIEGTTFTMGSENATLKATWQVNDYKYITKHYKQNIIDDLYTLVDADTEEKTATFNTTVTPSTKTYTGFISPSTKSLTITSNVLNNLVEYNYNREKHTLTVNPNGGTYNDITESSTYEMKYEETKTITNPTKTGYDFTGWSKTTGTLTDNVFTMNTSDSTLTANWNAKKFTITLNAGDGSVDPSTIEVTYDGTYGSLPEPTRENYDFLGWYTNTNYSTKIENTTKVEITQNQTLYANWKQKGIDIYDTMKTQARNTTIDFSQHSGLSGTNGIYTTTATEGNVPVYYYRGKVDNNLIFANYCWKIIRTTETGGVKIIYNGTPTSDGKCKPNFTAGTETAQSGTTYMPSSIAYYYGSSYTFDENAGYKLSGTIKSGVWSSSFASGVKNYYTCKNSVSTRACTTLYKITGYSSTTAATYSQIKVTVNTDTQTGTSAFNSSYKDNAYVGYMYGTTGASTYAATHANTNNSTIKTYLEGTNDTDGWFNTSGLKNYQDRLEDTVFCNDRSKVAGGNNNTLDSSTYGTLGYGTNPTGYGALERSSYYTTIPNPTYKCTQANDKFTISTERGNGKLKYPVGLITLDEAIFAGFNTYTSNKSDYFDTNNYLYTGSYYWTFSPVFYFSFGNAYCRWRVFGWSC